MKNHYNVLIVEDDAFIRKILRHSLKDDFNVTTQCNGVEAMSWLDEGHAVDIMLTDLHMPHMNGFELIRVVRASSLLHTLPIIVLSSVSDSGTRVSCLEQGADDYMMKPFSPVEIRAKILAHLRRSLPKPATEPVVMPVAVPLSL